MKISVLLIVGGVLQHMLGQAAPTGLAFEQHPLGLHLNSTQVSLRLDHGAGTQHGEKMASVLKNK